MNEQQFHEALDQLCAAEREVDLLLDTIKQAYQELGAPTMSYAKEVEHDELVIKRDRVIAILENAIQRHYQKSDKETEDCTSE